MIQFTGGCGTIGDLHERALVSITACTAPLVADQHENFITTSSIMFLEACAAMGREGREGQRIWVGGRDARGEGPQAGGPWKKRSKEEKKTGGREDRSKINWW